jgi:4-hydroxybenzoate polyprenyltransferase
LSPTHPACHAIQCVLWAWLHVLQFNLANQLHNPEEDIRNKPWRPLPSGRITLANVFILKYMTTAICLLLSYSYSLYVLVSSASLTVLIRLYHEMHGDQHWLWKNLMNSAGYTCFATGSTLVAGISSLFFSVPTNRIFSTEHNDLASDRCQLDLPGAFSVSVIAAILATTIQAQDFQDVIGDKAVGRNTLPIAFPNFSRYTVLVTLVMWSLYLTTMWEITTPAGVGFTFLGIVVGIRYYFWRSTTDDEWSYVLYNVSYYFPFCLFYLAALFFFFSIYLFRSG